MKKSAFFSIIGFISFFIAGAQYKNDNVSFRTVDPATLCETLKANPGYLLLDVRSSGEFHDTSSSLSLNIGHLQGARNIEVSELGKQLDEISNYKDKPVFVYCSHSQRSRRASKMLADSGFTKVFNINGGMTAIHYLSAANILCIEKMIITSTPYKVISGYEFCSNPKKYFILDVRPDSAWDHISRFPRENALGYIKGSTHISSVNLVANLQSIPHDEPLLITDISGFESANAATILKNNNYKDISVLIEGIDRFLSADDNDIPCRLENYQSVTRYQLVNSTSLQKFMEREPQALILDVRSTDEFTNKHKDSFRNIGRLKSAVNIPSDQLEMRMAELGSDKARPILVYAFSGNAEVYSAAEKLAKSGYDHVNLLLGGIFNVRWTAANRKGFADLANVVVDIPEINW